MHRCDIRKAFRRLKHKKCVGCAALLLGGFWHTPHLCSFWCVGGVLLSHNPTIAVPSAQSSLATGIGTGPGVPSTLKPPTQTHKTTTPKGRVASNTVQQTQTRQSFFFLRQTLALGAINCSFFIAHTHENTRCVILCRYISTSHLTTRHHAHSPGLSTPSSSGNLNRNLISKQASRLDAFSGYPSRT